MADLAQATAAGFEAYGITFYPLQIDDYGTLDAWLQNQCREEGLAFAKQQRLIGPLLDAWFRSTVQASFGITSGTPEGKRRLEGTVAGLGELLLVASHGKFTPDKLRAALEDEPEAFRDTFDDALEMLVKRVVALDAVPDDGLPGAEDTEPDPIPKESA